MRESRDPLEPFKIILFCVIASVVYGILHDFVTIHVCPEYFTVYHPKVFPTQNLWLLAIGWGTIASWWMGLFLGILIAAACLAGSLPPLGWRALVKPMAILLLSCYAAATYFGIWAYHDDFRSPLVDMFIPVASLPDRLARNNGFMADYIAHNVSYRASAIGALILCGFLIRKRLRLPRPLIAGGKGV